MYNVREIDLGKLNSLTKYPSIPTFHSIGERGALRGEKDHLDLTGTFYATEKVDGANARIIFMPDGHYLIGSREELLHCSGDVIYVPMFDIVPTLRPVAEWLLSERIVSTYHKDGDVIVVYCEVYGGNIGQNHKQYTGSRKIGYRVFDAMVLGDLGYHLGRSHESISAWRDNGGQDFFGQRELDYLTNSFALEAVPKIARFDASELPESFEGMIDFLRAHQEQTLVALDEGGRLKPEGMVIRSEDRSQIVKLRFEDYERTLRIREEERKRAAKG